MQFTPSCTGAVCMSWSHRMVHRLSIVATWIIIGLVMVPAATAQQNNEAIARHLSLVKQEMDKALEASQKAVDSASLEELKQNVDVVFESVWGVPSNLQEGSGAVATHGWKTRWQTDTDDFELETPAKFGTEPPQVSDPALLGIVGNGRHVRKLIWADSMTTNPHYDHITASLSNVIGWMRMDYAPARGGMPRVDLTYKWDAPTEFWLSTADTGWIFEVYTQAENILRTHYGDDLGTAKKHAMDLSMLLKKTMSGFDANNNGQIEPVAMEGGLQTALQHAQFAGFGE